MFIKILFFNMAAISRMKPLGGIRKLCDLFIEGEKERKGKGWGGIGRRDRERGWRKEREHKQ